MGLWTFLFWCVVISSVLKLIKSALDVDRDTRVAKVEADLKLQLVDRLKDPELVRRVIEARLPGAERLDEDAAKDAASVHAASPQAAAQQAAAMSEAAAQKAEQETAGHHVLVGMICFLVGLAFLIVSQVTEHDGLVIPGAVCSAVGLAFLAFATSQKQILRYTTPQAPEADSLRS